MESMTIACTRCGATCEGDIILPPLAFGFKHKSGCGHGVGPLAVLPGSSKPKKEEYKKVEGKSNEKIVFDEAEKIPVKEEIKVEETVEKPKKEKLRVFGKREKKEDAE